MTGAHDAETEVKGLLVDADRAQSDRLDRLVPLVYNELRPLARQFRALGGASMPRRIGLRIAR